MHFTLKTSNFFFLCPFNKTKGLIVAKKTRESLDEDSFPNQIAGEKKVKEHYQVKPNNIKAEQARCIKFMSCTLKLWHRVVSIAEE